MRNELSTTITEMMGWAEKSVAEVAELGKVDPAYLRCLNKGSKVHPGSVTLLKVYIGIIFDRELARKHPDMVQGLATLLEAAALSAEEFPLTGD